MFPVTQTQASPFLVHYETRYKQRNRSPETFKKAMEKRDRRASRNFRQTHLCDEYMHGPKGLWYTHV